MFALGLHPHDVTRGVVARSRKVRALSFARSEGGVGVGGCSFLRRSEGKGGSKVRRSAKECRFTFRSPPSFVHPTPIGGPVLASVPLSTFVRFLFGAPIPRFEIVAPGVLGSPMRIRSHVPTAEGLPPRSRRPPPKDCSSCGFVVPPRRREGAERRLAFQRHEAKKSKRHPEPQLRRNRADFLRTKGSSHLLQVNRATFALGFRFCRPPSHRIRHHRRRVLPRLHFVEKPNFKFLRPSCTKPTTSTK